MSAWFLDSELSTCLYVMSVCEFLKIVVFDNFMAISFKKLVYH